MSEPHGTVWWSKLMDRDIPTALDRPGDDALGLIAVRHSLGSDGDHPVAPFARTAISTPIRTCRCDLDLR